MAETNLPDFLLVGAAKCGTSSLHAYLAQHPALYLPTRVKEPNFFAYMNKPLSIRGPKDESILRALLLKKTVTSISDYRKLFKAAEPWQLLGEASPRYLYYPDAASAIKKVLGDPKIIMILRNPIDRAYSHFLMNRQIDLEPECDFVKAVALEDQRVAKSWGWDWHYMRVGCYAKQVKRYQSLFGADCVKVFLYDDLKYDTQAMLKNISVFLGVDEGFQPDTSERLKVASTKGAADSYFSRLVFATESTWLGRLAEKIIPQSIGRAAQRRLQQVLSKSGQGNKVPKLTYQQKRSLWPKVGNDVKELECLIGRDLSHWKP